MLDTTTLIQVNPVIPASDMVLIIDFYENKMGFKNVYDSTHYEDGPVNYAVLCREGICLHFQLFESLKGLTAPNLRIQVENIIPLFEEFKTRGILSDKDELKETPWGTKEFAFFDPNNTGLTFYEDI